MFDHARISWREEFNFLVIINQIKEASDLSPKFSAFPVVSDELRDEDNSITRSNDAPPSLDRSRTDTGIKVIF